MTLQEQLTERIKDAMKSKNTVALEALRSIKSALLLLQSEDRTKEITVEEEMKLLQKLVKQRKESVLIFTQQNRQDLAETELAQCLVIETFLPKQLSEEEIAATVKSVIAAVRATGIKDMGKVIGAVSKELAGKADGKTIADVVKRLLS